MKVNADSYWIAVRIIKSNKRLQDRIDQLSANGLDVQRKFTLKKSGYLKPTKMEYSSKNKEFRMVVGYRPNHLSREAICVVWKE